MTKYVIYTEYGVEKRGVLSQEKLKKLYSKEGVSNIQEYENQVKMESAYSGKASNKNILLG